MDLKSYQLQLFMTVKTVNKLNQNLNSSLHFDSDIFSTPDTVTSQ